MERVYVLHSPEGPSGTRTLQPEGLHSALLEASGTLSFVFITICLYSSCILKAVFLGTEFWEAKSPGVTTSDQRQGHPAPTQGPRTHASFLIGAWHRGLARATSARGAAASELGGQGRARGVARPWRWPPGQWDWCCPCLTAAWLRPLGRTPSFALKVVLSWGEGPSWGQRSVSGLLLSGRFYLFSGGVPFIICGVTAATNIRNYGTEGEDSA